MPEGFRDFWTKRRGSELEQELDWIADRIAVGQEIKKALEKTELDGVMLKEVALHYSGGARSRWIPI